MANSDKQKQRSCLYDLGWIRQKGEWLHDLMAFAGITERIDMVTLDKRLRAQVQNGKAYVDGNYTMVDEAKATFIRLDTGIVVPKEKTGDENRYLIIKFKRNQYGMWVGLDFEFGDVAENAVEEKGTGPTHSDPFLQDIYWPKGWQDQLQDLAVEEKWGNEYGAAGLLQPYIRYTYRRLKTQRKIVNNDNFLLFNTGLVTRDSLEPIVAICKRNDVSKKQRWMFDRFISWTNQDASRKDLLLMRQFSETPQKADWLEVLTKPLLPSAIKEDWTAIEGHAYYPCEMLMALSISLENDQARVDSDTLMRMESANLQSECELRKAMAGKILKELGDVGEVRIHANDILHRAFALAVRLLSWEIGTAVPMWDPSSDNYNFMIPLSFGEDPLKADIALRLVPISDKNNNGAMLYRPESFLTLQAAYSNARLLRRPEASWLRDYIEKQ